MARRLALAVPRTLPIPPALSLPSPRLPSRRTVVVSVALAAVLLLAYLAARVTPLFAVRAVEVSGAPAPVAADVREALREVSGESLLALDAAELEARLRQVPLVRSARVDRAFPHTLAVVVRPERPLAVAHSGRRAWVVAESGRVLETVEPGARRRLARIMLPNTPRLVPGASLADARARTLLATLRAVPTRFPARVLAARAERGGVTLVVTGWIAVRVGRPVELGAKLDAAAAVLRSLPLDERKSLAYLDVSLPRRAVALPRMKSKVRVDCSPEKRLHTRRLTARGLPA